MQHMVTSRATADALRKSQVVWLVCADESSMRVKAVHNAMMWSFITGWAVVPFQAQSWPLKGQQSHLGCCTALGDSSSAPKRTQTCLRNCLCLTGDN